MDVSQEIIEKAIQYGGTGFTNTAQVVPSRNLQFAPGASIHKPVEVNITKIPFVLSFIDAVGFAGVDNTFVKVNLDIVDTGTDTFNFVEGYEAAKISEGTPIDVNTYVDGYFKAAEDNEVVNDYDPAIVTFGDIGNYARPALSVSLDNLKTGNIYVDSHVDVRLYRKDRIEHEYDEMFVKLKDEFYIGFHARNTRRLPYNVSCKIGDVYTDEDLLTSEERKLLAFN